MADNTLQGGSATIAADDVATLNGVASSGVLVQRVKNTYGDDGTARDVSTAYPLPAVVPSALGVGTITAANTTPDVGGGTANSSVILAVPDGHSSVSFVLGGTFSAGTTLAFQTSIDGGSTWWYTNARRSANTLGVNETISNVSTDVVGGAAPTGGNPSFWRGTSGSSRMYRVTCITYTAADAVTVTIVSSAGMGGTYQLGSIPAGTSNIGAVSFGGDATTATITNTAPAAVTTTAAQILAASTTRRAILLENQGSDYIYIGATGVTATSYFKRVAPGETVSMTPPFMPTNALFAIAGSGTQTLGIGVLT